MALVRSLGLFRNVQVQRRGKMILRGWKNICAAVGGMSPATARKLMQEQGMPVSIIAGAPMATTEALEEWVQCRCQKIDLRELSEQLAKVSAGQGSEPEKN